MATNTYVALDKVTVGTATPSITFSSISGGYTDLVIVIDATNSAGAGSNGWGTRLRFNGDTASNYSWTIVNGSGSTASSARGSSVTSALAGWSNGGTTSSTQIVHVMNYANSTTYKTTIGRSANSAERTAGIVNLWRSTAAVTSITIFDEGSNNWQTGSTFSLYGISTVGDASPKATGGDVYSDANYWYHAFTMSGNFIPNQTLSCDILTIAGGGAGGRGGGGAGGLVYLTSQSIAASAQAVIVGGGGAAPGSDVSGLSNAGNNSQFAALTAAVGGGAGAGSNVNGGNGGSGGGGGTGSGVTRNGGTATSGQGNAGGSAPSTSGFGSGGGGGASAVGGNGTSLLGGSGGAGSNTYSSWATATSTGVSGYYAGGGGGNSNSSGSSASGGAGGGGTGIKDGNSTPPTAGVASTGGGGGGGGSYYTGGAGAGGAAGGSGIVIVRYAK